MATVQTIAGPIDNSELGRTLSHEHLCVGRPGMEYIPGLYDEALAHEAGIRSLLDVTPLDLGRRVALFEAVRDRSPVQIVAATGVYRWVPLIYYAWDADRFAEYLLSEIQDGIEGSDIRAGIIKLAWDMEYRLDEGPRSPRAELENCARGAARAAKAAGVPISCHTLATDELGMPLLDLFEEEGVDLRAVTIGHSNDTADVDYLLRLAKRGATVGLDRYGTFRGEEEMVRRAGLALELVKAVYAEQTCLGHDGPAYSLVVLGPPGGGPRPPDPDCWLPVPQFEVPWLLEHGASEDDIEALLQRSVRASFEAAAAMTR